MNTKKLLEKMGNLKLERTPEEIRQINKIEAWAKLHGRPQTRREFLHSGLVMGTGALVAPNILNVLSNAGVAHAADCGVQTSTKPGFVGINLAGGASLASYFLPKGKYGEYLNDYTSVGLGLFQNAQTTEIFGPQAPASSAASGFTIGLLQAASQTTLDNSTALLLCTRLDDDTADNQINLTPYIAPMTSQGTIVPPMGQNRNASDKPIPATLRVGSPDDVGDAVGFNAGVLGNELSDSSKRLLFDGIKNLTNLQLNSIAQQSGSNLLKDLMSAATRNNSELVGNAGTNFDPSQNANLANANIWDFNEGGQNRAATIVYNVLQKNSGLGLLEMGGYDYHGNGLANQIDDDTQVGLLCGRLLETAAVLGEPLVIACTTDGATGHENNPDGLSAPTSDSGRKSCAFMLFYDPNGRPQQARSQLGWAEISGRDIGMSENTSAITTSATRLVAAIAANYANFAGNVGLFEAVAAGVFSQQELEQVLAVTRAA